MENPETGIRLVVGKEDAQYVQGAVTVRRLFRRRHDQEYWTTGRVIRRADQSIVDHQSAVLKLVADESSGRRSRKFLASAQKRPRGIANVLDSSAARATVLLGARAVAALVVQAKAVKMTTARRLTLKRWSALT